MDTEGPRQHGFHGHGSSLFVVAIVFFIIALLAVGSRCWIRYARRQTFGLDDHLIIASLIFSFIVSLDVIIGVYVGYGARSATLSKKDRESALKTFYVCQIAYKLLLNSTKASILALYHRIFPAQAFRRAVYITAIVFIGYGIGSILASVFVCLPLARFWNRAIPGTCFDLEAFWYTNAAMNITGDIVILILPMYPVWKLHLGRNERMALLGVFGLWLFVTVTSIIRMQELKPGSKATDQIYGTMSSTMWSVIEPNTGILCACLPLLKVPIVALFPKLFARSNGMSCREGYPSRSPSDRPPAYTAELEAFTFPSKVHGSASFRPARHPAPGRPQQARYRSRPEQQAIDWRAWLASFRLFAGRPNVQHSRNGMKSWSGTKVKGENTRKNTDSSQSSNDELRVNVTKDIDVRYEEKEIEQRDTRSDEEVGPMDVVEL